MISPAEGASVGHSPLPWCKIALHPSCILAAGQLIQHSFRIAPDEIHAKVDPEAAKALCEANADLICRSVNALPDLLRTLEECQSVLATLLNPENRAVSAMYIWAQAIEAEAKARAAIQSAMREGGA